MTSVVSKRSFVQQATGRAVKHLNPVGRNAARGLVAEVYAQAEREFALVPPITIHSAAPEILAGVWMTTREAFIVGKSGRVDREIVAAAVSQSNTCPFCVEVHSAMLHAAGRHQLADAMMGARGAVDASSPLAAWALATRSPGSAILASPPFNAEDAPGILGTAVVFHFINRMVNVFLEPSPNPIKTESGLLKIVFRRVFGATAGKRLINVEALPGASLVLLPEADLPAAFSWTLAEPAIAGAMARFTFAIEAAGVRVIPAAVRAVVEGAVSNWNGDDPGLSQKWLYDVVAGLPTEAEQATARLCLLTALASYRVDDAVVAAFRRSDPSDEALVSAAAWASLVAVKRLASWIVAPSLADVTSRRT